MIVGILTQEQKLQLDGQLVNSDWYFNPVLDCNDNWIISTEEINNSIYPQNAWVKDLSLIEWCEPIQPPSGTTVNEL